MAFLNIPLKAIQATVNTVIGVQSMPWYNPLQFPVIPPAPAPTPLARDFQWSVQMDITTQQHSSYITRDPGLYNGQDVTVGMWIANLTTGQAWQIISVDAMVTTSVTVTVQDIYRYNTFRDPAKVGNGSPATGVYVVFGIGDTGIPEIDPVPPAGISSTFSTNLMSRFEYINLQYDYPLYQAGNTFALNDTIAASSAINGFVKSDSTNQLVVGRVTSTSDTISGWFTINPVQKIVDFLDYLPGNVGDIIYASMTVPGGITTTPGGAQLYVELRKNTSSITNSTLPGPTTPGYIFQLNDVNVAIGGTGTMSDVISATNLQSLATGVTASLVLAPSFTQTDNAQLSPTYGEPALWASSSPATATINGVLVTFNITSTDAGYTDYARAPQMAESINDANIPNIRASNPNSLSLQIENIAGGTITIVNGTPDINSVSFAGHASGSGVALSTPASTQNQIQFIAIDARPITFLDVSGSVVEDYGLISVENGVKACGMYIADGLRTATSTVVTNLAALNALTPLIGDQAYVINSDDGNGNNVGEWSLWLYNGTTWVETSNQQSSSTDAKSLEYNVLFSSADAINIGLISTGRRVTLITIEVTVPFNGPAATLAIGYQVNNPSLPPPVPSGLMDSTIIDLATAGTYTTQTDILFGTDTLQGDVEITGTYFPGGSSAGAAKIIVSYV